MYVGLSGWQDQILPVEHHGVRDGSITHPTDQPAGIQYFSTRSLYYKAYLSPPIEKSNMGYRDILRQKQRIPPVLLGCKIDLTKWIAAIGHAATISTKRLRIM